MTISGNAILSGQPENPVIGAQIDHTRKEPVGLLPCPMFDHLNSTIAQHDSAAAPTIGASSRTALTRPTSVASEPASIFTSEAQTSQTAPDLSDLINKPVYGTLVKEAAQGKRDVRPREVSQGETASRGSGITIRSAGLNPGTDKGTTEPMVKTQSGRDIMQSEDQHAHMSRSLHGVGRAVVSQAAPLPPPHSTQSYTPTDPRDIWRSHNRQRLLKLMEDEASAKLELRNRAKEMIEQKEKQRAARIKAKHASLAVSDAVSKDGDAPTPGSSHETVDVDQRVKQRGWPGVYELITSIKVSRGVLPVSSTGGTAGVAPGRPVDEGRMDRMRQVIAGMCEHA